MSSKYEVVQTALSLSKREKVKKSVHQCSKIPFYALFYAFLQAYWDIWESIPVYAYCQVQGKKEDMRYDVENIV